MFSLTNHSPISKNQLTSLNLVFLRLNDENLIAVSKFHFNEEEKHCILILFIPKLSKFAKKLEITQSKKPLQHHKIKSTTS